MSDTRRTAFITDFGRNIGAPEEVAAVVSMLASDRGGFVNGQMIQVNGGAAM
jgi:NAD(P)-dependent dehydrogenase (short-subunit alcohol dehydrogenase family)